MGAEGDPPRDVVVLGGGRLGAAVARAAAAVGRRVTVASRTERAHAGLWRRWNAEDSRPPCAGATVILALAPGPKDDPVALWGSAVPRLAFGAWRDGAAAVCVCGPAGSGERGVEAFARGAAELANASRSAILRFGPLVGVDDGCVWPWVAAIRQSGVARLPKGLPPQRMLLLEDAARAALALADVPGARVLAGAKALGVDEVGEAITRRFGGKWAWSWWPEARRERLSAWAGLPDAWDEARLGPRRGVESWIEGLPGLRRGR